ncbi:hypothetical protein OPT61_g6620 [Boeremia exigua]|uniref:Uncharacterized protein n=1 Tax=Boeremia exigua TaxID=749465 RepID=A0ACC2I5W0_9PLEO|nr:hypothetical protein OPT61_g6620 [Boeremia exigua]
MPTKEMTVSSSTPMPKGYGFLPKGIRYKTLHSRKLTHNAGKTLYVVVDDKKRQIGLRVPISILHQVHRQAKETLPDRRAAVEKRDASFIDSAATGIEEQFPDIPEKEKQHVLKHGFRKHSGRVGRTGTIPLPRKIVLAVIAHTWVGTSKMISQHRARKVNRSPRVSFALLYTSSRDTSPGLAKLRPDFWTSAALSMEERILVEQRIWIDVA